MVFLQNPPWFAGISPKLLACSASIITRGGGGEQGQRRRSSAAAHHLRSSRSRKGRSHRGGAPHRVAAGGAPHLLGMVPVRRPDGAPPPYYGKPHVHLP